MAGSVNQAIIVGNVGRDPEVKALQNGGRVVSFSIATSESWYDKATGEKKEKTQWHRIVIWNEKIGEIAEKYVRKGSKVYIQGQIETRKYTDRDNNERETTEIVLTNFRGQLVLLGDPSGESRAPHHSAHSAHGAHTGGASRPAPSGSSRTGMPAGVTASQAWQPGGGDMDDEIPFGPEWR